MQNQIGAVYVYVFKICAVCACACVQISCIIHNAARYRYAVRGR